MGIGDEIMVTARARAAQVADPRPVLVLDRDGKPRFDPIWANNPRMVQAADIPYLHRGQAQTIVDGPGCRPYIDYATFSKADRSRPWVFKEVGVSPGEIYLTPAEKALGAQAANAVILEPNIKPGASPNKDWGWSRWETLAAALGDLRLVQLGPQLPRMLHGVEWIQTKDFRQAVGVLSGARLLIAPEGALHHAAAALGIPAVVIFGGYISPATTGYSRHLNLFAGGKGCGSRVPCRHCAEAMAAIRPEYVETAARGLLA